LKTIYHQQQDSAVKNKSTITVSHHIITPSITRSTQPGHPSVGRRNEYQQKLGHKQAHHAMH